MNLSDPSQTITPTLDGAVLVVLARAGRPLTVGEVTAESVRGSEIGVRRCLARLVDQGIVRATADGAQPGTRAQSRAPGRTGGRTARRPAAHSSGSNCAANCGAGRLPPITRPSSVRRPGAMVATTVISTSCSCTHRSPATQTVATPGDRSPNDGRQVLRSTVLLGRGGVAVGQADRSASRTSPVVDGQPRPSGRRVVSQSGCSFAGRRDLGGDRARRHRRDADLLPPNTRGED